LVLVRDLFHSLLVSKFLEPFEIILEHLVFFNHDVHAPQLLLHELILPVHLLVVLSSQHPLQLRLVDLQVHHLLLHQFNLTVLPIRGVFLIGWW